MAAYRYKNLLVQLIPDPNACGARSTVAEITTTMTCRGVFTPYHCTPEARTQPDAHVCGLGSQCDAGTACPAASLRAPPIGDAPRTELAEIAAQIAGIEKAVGDGVAAAAGNERQAMQARLATLEQEVADLKKKLGP